MPVVVRPIRPAEHAAVGELTAGTYLAEGWATAGYARSLRDLETRTAHGLVLVAADEEGAADGGELLGALTVATSGGPLAEQSEPGEAVIRHLVTAPASRGRGVGDALVRAALDAARAAGCRLVRLSTEPGMAAARRLYERLGFVRVPARDWSPEPGVALLAYALALVPYCDQCGEELLGAEHPKCGALRRLDPPRWCPQCRRRMVVQVTPTGWSAKCVEHGVTTG